MSKLSPQSEAYLKRFRSLIKLYPRKHQQDYADAMVQLLRDQLEDAERLGDAHIQREVFVHAVLGIPGSLMKEYTEVLTRGDIRTLWEEAGVSRWRAANYFFFFFLVLAELVPLLRLDSLLWVSIATVAATGAALTLLIFVFLDTRRLFLSFMLLLIGVGGELLAGTVVSGLSYRALNTGVGSVVSPVVSTSFLLLVPFLLAYLLAALFHAYPQRFRRVDIAKLSESELKAFQQRIAIRRLRNKRIFIGAVGVFVLMNLAGLYDPSVSHADLDLPVRSIPDDQNMVKELTSLPVPAETSDSTQDTTQSQSARLYLNDSWNEEQAASLLAGKEQTLATVLSAAQKPYFQDPGFADLSVYKTVEEATSAPIAPLSGLRMGTSLALLQAEYLRRAGDIDGALTYNLAVLHIGDAMQVSQATIIGNLVGNAIRKDALTVLTKILASPLTSEQRTRVQVGVSALHGTKAGIANALKAEYNLSRIVVTGLRGDGMAAFFYPSPSFSLYSIPARLPFFFQPNRTVGGISDKLRDQLSYLDRSCKGLVIPQEKTSDAFPFEIGIRTLQFNGIGKLFITYSYPYTSLLQNRCTYDAQVEEIEALVNKK